MQQLQTQQPEQPAFFEQRILMLALTFIGGSLDAYTYVMKDRVFGNSQTGNLVNFAFRVARKEYSLAVESFVPIVTFILGMMVSSWVKTLVPKNRVVHYTHVGLFIEFVLITGVSFVPEKVPLVTVIGVSLACSFQYAYFRKIKGVPFATTMCTGNMRTFADNFYSFLVMRDMKAGRNAFWLFAVVVTFWCGSAFTAYMTEYLKLYTALISSGIILIVLLGMLLYSAAYHEHITVGHMLANFEYQLFHHSDDPEEDGQAVSSNKQQPSNATSTEKHDAIPIEMKDISSHSSANGTESATDKKK